MVRIPFVCLLFGFHLACGPAEPLDLSAIRIEVGESGTLFYNRAQQMVRAGDVIELSVQLPLDVHFHDGSDWWSERVATAGTVTLGPALEIGLAAASKVLEVAGADEVVARCDKRLFYAAPATFMSSEKRIAVPQNESCSFLGLKMNGSFPARYDLRTLDSSSTNRIVFQPTTSFEQSLSAQVDEGGIAHVESWLTLDGFLTRFPLGEGGVTDRRGLAVLSPSQSEQLGVWLLASERVAPGGLSFRRMGLHLASEESQALIEWPKTVSLTPTPADMDRAIAWTGELRLLEKPDRGFFRAKIEPLLESDIADWHVLMPIDDALMLPERPFLSDDALEQMKVSFVFVDTIYRSSGLPIDGQQVPALMHETHFEGYFRSSDCDGDVGVYGYWNVLEECNSEQMLNAVFIDECGRLLPYDPHSRYPIGTMDASGFIRENGTVLPIQNDDGVLTVGTGGQSFTLSPRTTVDLDLPSMFKNVRGSVEVTEQVYEYRDGEVGQALDVPAVVYASPWRGEAAYQGRSSGEIVIRAGPFNFETFLTASELESSGYPMRRLSPLCANYSEQLFIRAESERIIVEQWVTAVQAQTTLRRLFVFE